MLMTIWHGARYRTNCNEQTVEDVTLKNKCAFFFFKSKEQIGSKILFSTYLSEMS